MMRLKYILLIVFGTIFLCSCSKELKKLPNDNVLLEKGYAISIDEALSSLENFMIEKGMPVTKGCINDYIDNYFSVSCSTTKLSADEEVVLYAVNFKENGGYALLAADTRIPEDILAVTDSGCVNETDFEEIESARVPTVNDDLAEDEYYEMVESGVLAAAAKQINRECYKYARKNIDDIYNVPDMGTMGGHWVSYTWETVKEVPRMLNTVWTQSTQNNDIFNKYCPEVGLIWRSIAPAGCVCIAVSQIIAYHEYPANLTCNGMLINYPEMKEIYSYDNFWNEGSDTGKEMLARFCINVGAKCNTKYHSIFGNAWGFAWPSGAKSCLEKFGYQNVSLNWGYDESLVIKALDNGCPVFMAAIAKLISGHAWVIDGYMKRNYVSSDGSVSKTQMLVHCNWGWHCNCNGYFTSGVFHTQDAVTYDRASGNTADENYWHAYYTVTYDKPQK